MKSKVQVFRERRRQVAQEGRVTELGISRNRSDVQPPQEGRKITNHHQFMETGLHTTL